MSDGTVTSDASTSDDLGVDEGVAENTSLFVALGAIGLAVLAALMLYMVSPPAAWISSIGVVLVAIGVLAGSRGAVGVGVGVLAIASLTATSNAPLGLTLGLNAVMAVMCIMVLVIGDLSFAMRRATVVSPITVQGLLLVHGAALALGLLLSIFVVAAVLAVSWPDWLLFLPAIVLGVAAIVLAGQATRYNRKLRTVPTRPGASRMPPPPPVGIRSTMPPPPAPGARPTRQVPPPPGQHHRPPPPIPGTQTGSAPN